MQTEFKATYSDVYDEQNLSTNYVACSELDQEYPELGDIPGFPFIGAAPNNYYDSPTCGACWKITNVGNGRWIYFTSIDDSDPYEFVLSQNAFNELGGDKKVGNLQAAVELAPGHCGKYSK